jgi:heparanase 1
MLGSFASSGVSLFARQCLNSVINPQTEDGGGATPGFWVAIMWKRLMGTSVFNVTVIPQPRSSNSALRAYAHRTPRSAHGVTLMLLNLNDATVSLTQIFMSTEYSNGARLMPGDATAQRYTLTAGPAISRFPYTSVLLNGKLLDFASKDSTSLPDLDGVATGCNNVTLPPNSVTWLVVDDPATMATVL